MPSIKFILGNILRLLTITSLACSGVATGSLIPYSAFKTSRWNAYAGAEKVLLATFILFLLLTEIPKSPLKTICNRYMPLFSEDAGLLALSFSLLYVGFDVLSYLTEVGKDGKTVGVAFYMLVQAAGFMTLVVAVLNFVGSFVLNGKREGLSARGTQSMTGKGRGVMVEEYPMQESV